MFNMMRQPVTGQDGVPVQVEDPSMGGLIPNRADGAISMTRKRLAAYDFYSIEFIRDGEQNFGFLSHDRRGDAFVIVYSVVEQGAERRMTLVLRDEEIGRIRYDEVSEMLVLP
jgi:hypothetical protein